MSTPAVLAKGALRRLAAAQQEPTPEHFARAYAEEAGQAPLALPERARTLLERLAGRVVDDAPARAMLVGSLMKGEWDAAARLIDGAAEQQTARAQAWPVLIERLARGLERGARQWTTARKKDSLQRVLDGSRSDPQKMQQRLQSLLTAWESDAAGEAPAEAAADTPPTATPEVGQVPAATASAGAAVPQADATAGTAPAWPAVTGPLARTVQAALPGGDPRAAALADTLGQLADRLAADGATPTTVDAVAEACEQARRLLAHRHHLFDSIEALCSELTEGLAELSEDESWAQGQCAALKARLAGGVNARSARAASALLAETRERQAAVRAERQQANQALKAMIQQLLGELGALEAETGRFEQTVGRHVQAIEQADSLESLTGVVQALLGDSRAVQTVVQQTNQRLQRDHARASELESKVRTLESELRRLSEEVSTDALTQVANRRGLMQAFEAEAARVARAEPGSEQALLAVGLIDIDNFKKLNDTLGHAAGDVALKSLAAAVTERLRPVDRVARFGGEEFVLLLPATPVGEAQQAVTRLQRSLSASLFMHDGREVFVTFSAGVTAWQPGEALDAALERADEALYEAKRTGKNRTCIA